jgi:hypothetical protein
MSPAHFRASGKIGFQSSFIDTITRPIALFCGDAFRVGAISCSAAQYGAMSESDQRTNPLSREGARLEVIALSVESVRA